MLEKLKLLGGAVAVIALASMPVYADSIQTFDVAGPLNDWYTDRYEPDTFEAAGGVLHQRISSDDSSTNRPSAYSAGFYNTQGRKYDVDLTTTYMSIDLYIPDLTLTGVDVGRRYAGFWGTAVDAFDVISGYPIIEYHRQGANFDGAFGFSTYNPLTGAWTDLGLPSPSSSSGGWYTLEMEFSGDDLTYTIGNLSHTVADTGSVRFINTILQGYNPTSNDFYGNTQTGADYDIYWDNFVTEAPVVPVPAAAGLGMLGMGLVGFLRRRKNTAA